MTAKEMAGFLKSYHWDYFLTVTPRHPRKDPLAFMRDVWDDIKPDSPAIKALTGNLPEKNVQRAFLACEPFFLGHNLHVHGLLAGGPDINLPWWFNDVLNTHLGRSRVELCRSEEQVSAYCAKYVSKFLGGDNYDFFGEWTWDLTSRFNYAKDNTWDYSV